MKQRRQTRLQLLQAGLVGVFERFGSRGNETNICSQRFVESGLVTSETQFVPQFSHAGAQLGHTLQPELMDGLGSQILRGVQPNQIAIVVPILPGIEQLRLSRGPDARRSRSCGRRWT